MFIKEKPGMGLSNYSSQDIALIKGLKTAEIEQTQATRPMTK
ncbi:MAG: hypothetical protein ACLFUU_11015 [Desulfobacteraceae bacterium]